MECNINISTFRKDLFQVCDAVIDNGMIANVSCKNGNVVVMSEKDFKGLIETLHLSTDPYYLKTLLDGKNTKSGDLIDEKAIEW